MQDILPPIPPEPDQPYRGTKITTLRIPAELRKRIEAAMISANRTRKDQPYTTTAWIIAALMEKLDHLQRSRRPKRDLVSCQPDMYDPPEPEGYHDV